VGYALYMFWTAKTVVLDSQRDVLDGPLKIPNETYMIPNVFRKITVTHTMKKCFLLETIPHTNCTGANFLWLSKERVSTEFFASQPN
jgi:hypothetical protein